MKPDNYNITLKMALIGLICTPIHPIFADTFINLGDNTNPADSFPSTINSTPFAPGTELRIVDPTGNLSGGLPAHKDILTGNESWSFDSVTGELTGVNNTDLVNGNSTTTQSYIDSGYVDPGTCQTGCPALFNTDNAIYFGVPYEFVAPLPGTPEGTENGPLTLTVTTAITFEMHMPILEVHWAGTRGLLGKAGNKGVTFFCSGQPQANFHCTMEHTSVPSEDVDSTGVFSGFTVQMEFSSTISTAVSLNVTGGTSQECSSHSGNLITLSANVATSPGTTVDTINWLVDGVAAGSGASIQSTLELGSHFVEVNVLTNDGKTTSSSETVTIVDTKPPEITPAFVSPFTGLDVTKVTRLFTFLQSNFEVFDTCDASPITEGVLGKVAVDGEYIWVTAFEQSVRLQTNALNLKVIATDAAGNFNIGEVDLLINP